MNINQLEQILETDGIVFLTYGGLLSQELLIAMTNALEQESELNQLSMATSVDLLTVFIELTQNMMNYAKSSAPLNLPANSKGLILVGHEQNSASYYALSKNIISAADKEKITQHIEEVVHLDKAALRTLYRERRKSGQNVHTKGSGLGFYEIARRCNKLEYNFDKINDSEAYYFIFKATLTTQGK